MGSMTTQTDAALESLEGTPEKGAVFEQSNLWGYS